MNISASPATCSDANWPLSGCRREVDRHGREQTEAVDKASVHVFRSLSRSWIRSWGPNLDCFSGFRNDEFTRPVAVGMERPVI